MPASDGMPSPYKTGSGEQPSSHINWMIRSDRALGDSARAFAEHLNTAMSRQMCTTEKAAAMTSE